jgi:hypothetical protein
VYSQPTMFLCTWQMLNLFTPVCVCVCVCVCTCMHAHTHTYIYAYVHIHPQYAWKRLCHKIIAAGVNVNDDILM